MVLTPSVKQLLRNNAESVPEQVPARGSLAVRLRLADRTFTLIDRAGKPTEAGRFWYREVKNDPLPQVGYDPETEVLRRHKTDYIMMRSGTRADLRTWHPELNRFVYTRLGEEFFERRPRQYIVSIPTRITIKRQDGRTYQMRGQSQSSPRWWGCPGAVRGYPR